MRGAAGFWLGVVVTAAVFAATGGTTVNLRLTGTEAAKPRLDQTIDGGPLVGLLAPEAPAIGTLHINKHNWGIVTTYAETLAAPGARAAGVPDIRLRLTIPGAVTASNAAGREGRALVWTGLPGPEPAWASSQAINWPVVVLALAAVGVSFWLRDRNGERTPRIR